MYSSSILNDYDYNDTGHISKTNTSSVHYNHHDNDKKQHQHQHQYERREREGNYIRNSGSILVKLRILLDAYDQLVTIFIKNKEIAFRSTIRIVPKTAANCIWSYNITVFILI